MELRDIIRDAFLFVATFRQRLEKGQLPHGQVVYQEVKDIFNAMDARAMEDPAVRALYDKIRYAITGLVDEIIVGSTWNEAQSWPVLELEFYGTNVAGNRVLDFINSLTPGDTDLVEASFYILALGFRGEYVYDEAKWEELLMRLYRMLPHRLDEGEFKISPDAYHVIRKKAQRLDPLFSLWRSVIIFGITVLFIIVFYQVVWISMVDEADKISDEVLLNVRDEDLRHSLKEVKE